MNTNTNVSISVVIPAFNAESYIAATLRSIQAQNYSDVEVVIVDGASQDETVRIARSFTSLNLNIISEPDRGQLEALQKGLRLARNDVVLWLNADDIVMPNAFATVSKAFQNRNVDFVFSDDIAFDESKKEIYYGPTIKGLTDLDHFLFYRQLYSECVYWRREITAYLEPSSFDLRVYTDYAFFLNLRWKRRGLWLPQRLGAFRIRSGQASAAFAQQKQVEYSRVKNEHRAKVDWSRASFTIMQAVHFPSFALRQRLIPTLKRGGRRMLRAVTSDRSRRLEAVRFYSNWLLPLSGDQK